MACLGAATSALAADNTTSPSSSGTTNAATQMLPPTAAGSTASCGTANSILSFNPSPGVGSAINCSPATVNPSNGNLSAGGGLFSSDVEVGGVIKNTHTDSGLVSNGVYYGTNIATNGRFQSGDMDKGGNGGLWVARGNSGAANPASAQFFGSMDATHFGLWNQAAGSPTVPSNWRLIVDSAGNVGIGSQNPQSTLDVNGNVSAPSYSAHTTDANGNIVSASMGYAGVSAASQLAATNCSAGQAVTATTVNGAPSVACVNVADLPGGVEATVPTCNAGSVLTFAVNTTTNKPNFACTPLPVVPAAAPVPTADCQGNNVLQWSAANKSYQCVAISTLTSTSGSGSCANPYDPAGNVVTDHGLYLQQGCGVGMLYQCINGNMTLIAPVMDGGYNCAGD